jgi:hypothetical protein
MTAKLIYLARRNPTLAAADFPEAWRSHSRLASTLGANFGQHFPRVRQCVKVWDEDLPQPYANDYDGSALLTMKSHDDLKAAQSHPDALSTMRDDELRVFAEHAANFTLAAEETGGFGDPDGQAVLLRFVARADAVSPAAFQHAWAELSDRMARAAVAGARGLILNRVVESPGPRYAFAGISELWFEDVETARQAAWSEALQSACAAVDGLSDRAGTVALLARLNLDKQPVHA